VQCDSEPKAVPPPQSKVSSTTLSSSELTESSSTDITSTRSKSSEDSYMSDGMWLISKSEGQIVQIPNEGKLNLIIFIIF
jgi:hypothetical protein